MATESLKAFGIDFTNMQLSKESVKNISEVLKQPKLVQATNKWIHENNVAGERVGETRVLDVDDPRIQEHLKNLSAKERDQVEDVINKHSVSMQHMQEQILEKRLLISSTNGAAIAQLVEGGKLKDNVMLSEALLRAFIANRKNPVEARKANAQINMVQNKMSLEGFTKLVDFAATAAEAWKVQQELFQKNPAWSTAQRSGKFLLSYTKNGKAQLRGVNSKAEAENHC